MDYYLITMVSLLITMFAQFFVTSTYKKNLKINNDKNITGKEAARIILDKNGLQNINVVETQGFLTDHYDPQNKIIRLSSDVYSKSSISSVAVACHECGHAIQDKENYTFLRIRSSLVPLINFASKAGYIAILIGLIASSFDFIYIGIICEIAILVFQLITLPVEFNASSRALKQIKEENLLNNKELSNGKNVLIAAALTYVASVLSSLLEIMRLLLILSNSERRR